MRTVTTLAELRQQAAAKNPRRWRRWAAAVVLLLLIGGVVWAWRPDPHFARVQELQKELASAKDLSPEDRKAKFKELRTEMKHLSDDQKWDLAAPMREKHKVEMDRYFSLSPKEKTKYLDVQIDRSEQMRKSWQKKAASGSRPPGGTTPVSSGRTARPPRSKEEMEKERRARLDRTSPEERARSDLFRKELNDRRRQRGLPVR